MGQELIDKKRHESLRCLFASVASIVVLDWLLEKKELRDKIADEAIEINEKLINIRTIFLAGAGRREDVIHSVVQVGSPLMNHIHAVLFADAVRWWAAAHRNKHDKNKYLSVKMFDPEHQESWRHFYQEFRNEQLAHFPGGVGFDDILITPLPYNFLLSLSEIDNFKRILAYSIHLVLTDEDGREQFTDAAISQFLADLNIPEDQREVATAILKETRDLALQELLSAPTRNFFEKP